MAESANFAPINATFAEQIEQHLGAKDHYKVVIEFAKVGSPG